MALIYRAICEIEDLQHDFVSRAPGHAQDWLRWKLNRDELELPSDGMTEVEDGIEVAVSHGADDDCRVYRITVFEGARDDGVEVKTTFTALSANGASWSWVDLERWTADPAVRPWAPTAPGIIGTLLRGETARRGPTILTRGPQVVNGNGGADIARLVVDVDRELPVVVAAYSDNDEDGVTGAENRGWELSRRLAGVASVFVLGRGAVSSFSRAMLELVGPDVDVYSGAVRAYLPGVGVEGDHSARHRFVPFRTLRARSPLVAARILAPALVRRAVESPPPPIWRERAKRLIDGVADRSDADLLELAEAEMSEQGTLIEEQRAQILELEEQIAYEREAVDDLLQQNDGLARKVLYLRGAVVGTENAGAAYAEPPRDEFEPFLCGEVAREADSRFGLIVIPEAVLAGADALDEHGDLSWGRKAWLTFSAMQAYAEAKRDNAFDGDFKSFCESSGGTAVISSQWVARNETKLTMSNQRFRDLRDLPISTEVAQGGKILMEEHIKIRQGGSPCPRIHYYDDTRGPTGKIHVGWFGDHLDSRGKS